MWGQEAIRGAGVLSAVKLKYTGSRDVGAGGEKAGRRVECSEKRAGGVKGSK